MCLGVPGKIVKIEDNKATVEIMGVTREISIELLKNIQVGDYVIIHAGCAIEKVDEEEAQKTLEIFKDLKELYHE